MRSIDEHCKHTFDLYGFEGREIHQWIDEPVKVAGFQHRRFRHNIDRDLPICKDVFKNKYTSEQIENVFLDHILADNPKLTKVLTSEGEQYINEHSGKDKEHWLTASKIAQYLDVSLATVQYYRYSHRLLCPFKKQNRKRLTKENAKILEEFLSKPENWTTKGKHEIADRLGIFSQSVWSYAKRHNLYAIAICPNCNKEYHKRHFAESYRFCSIECAKRSKHPLKNCLDCGKEFEAKHKKSKYCIDCAEKSHYDKKEHWICVRCGKEFKPTGSSQKYCSECKAIKKICPYCKVEFSTLNKDKKYCSDACMCNSMSKISSKKKGKSIKSRYGKGGSALIIELLNIMRDKDYQLFLDSRVILKDRLKDRGIILSSKQINNLISKKLTTKIMYEPEISIIDKPELPIIDTVINR